MQEEWRNIEGYENYQVSNMGQVKSLIDNHGKPREKILRQTKMKDGYLFVNLWKDGKSKTCTVHRLVAQAFIDNPNNHPQVNHKNEDKTDNLVDNLEWCTQKYNLNYGSRIAKAVASTDYKAIVKKRKIDYKAISKKLTNRQDQSKPVYQYDKNGTLVAIWQSTRECGRNGFNQGHVAACCRGKLKHYKGFIWSYVPIDPI